MGIADAQESWTYRKCLLALSFRVTAIDSADLNNSLDGLEMRPMSQNPV
jgi:hypothetical protein